MSSNYQSIHGLLLSNLELADMRADQLAGMPDTCAVLRGTITPTGSGGGSVSWGTVYTNEPCRLYLRWWERVREEDFYAEREASLQRHALRMRHDVDVREADRIVCRGYFFEVEFVSVGQSWQTAKTVHLNVLSGS